MPIPTLLAAVLQYVYTFYIAAESVPTPRLKLGLAVHLPPQSPRWVTMSVATNSLKLAVENGVALGCKRLLKQKRT